MFGRTKEVWSVESLDITPVKEIKVPWNDVGTKTLYVRTITVITNGSSRSVSLFSNKKDELLLPKE